MIIIITWNMFQQWQQHYLPMVKESSGKKENICRLKEKNGLTDSVNMNLVVQ